MTIADSPTPSGAEVHVCDNYAQLLVATADLAGRRSPEGEPPLLLFLDDRLRLADDLRTMLADTTGADIVVASDLDSIERFARLPRWMPAIVRRNVSWTRRRRPIRPSAWRQSPVGSRSFEAGYVYHPGYFLSKVVAGRCQQVVMRDCGYAAYVRHRVPWSRKATRVVARRSPRWQIWGEERWVDRIQVARPELLPASVRHKAERVAIDELMGALEPITAQRIADAFWGDAEQIRLGSEPTALLLTQPIDDLGMCTTAEKRALYAGIARRLRDRGFAVAVKPHPREFSSSIDGVPSISPAFPIEAWTWRGQRPFDVAVSLNSAALAPLAVSFAAQTIQLVPYERFYPAFADQWGGFIDQAFAAWPVATGQRSDASERHST